MERTIRQKDKKVREQDHVKTEERKRRVKIKELQEEVKKKKKEER